MSSEAASSLSCSLDNAAFARCPSPISYSGLAEGTHNLRVRATDTVGNVGDPVSFSWFVDLTAPAAPTAAPAATTINVRTNSVTFSGEDNATFSCSFNNGAYTACTSPRSFSSMPDGDHTFAVKQTDEAGNTGPATTVTWLVDTQAPAAPVAVTPDPITRQKAASIAFIGQEGGGTFSCSLDSTAPVSCTSPFTASGLGDGRHTLVVRHRDAAGNTSAPTTRSWVVDTVAPDSPSVAGPASPSNATSPRIAFSGEAGATFQCSVDSPAFVSCASPWTPGSPLAAGPHSFAVRQTDQAGNTSTAASLDWTIDTTAPVPPKLTVPNSPTTARSASVRLEGEPGATFRCSIDGAAWAACADPLELADLADGGHAVAARQSDRAGNEGPVATAEWTVDGTPPPTPVLSGTPASLTSSNRASIAFVSEGEAVFRCSLDGADPTPCTSPLTLTGLADGAHSLRITAVDPAGNESPAATVIWTIDRTAPAGVQFTDQPAGFTNATSALIRFGGEADATFTCSVDGGLYSPCSSPRSLTALSDGQHSLAVRATDRAGNVSPVASATWIVDTTPPAAPTAGALSGVTTVRTASVSFSGEIGASFRCSLDGSQFAACVSPRFMSGLADGQHTLAIKQVDRAGNESPATTRSWTVDATPPAAPSLAGTPPELTRSASATISFTSDQGATFLCSVDEGPFAACNSPRALAGLSDGQHSLTVRAKDAAGNLSDTSTARWTVDRTPPAAPVATSQPNAFVASRSAELEFTGEDGAKFECSVDKGAWKACSSPFALNGLKDGAHSVSLRQTDAAGNLGVAATNAWTVDLTAPAAPKLSGVPGPFTNSRGASISITGEQGATFECLVDDGEWGTCGSPKALAGLGDGQHALSARQTDRAGNTGPLVRATWTVDTIAPGLVGPVRTRLAGRATTITTAFDVELGRPERLEFATSRSAPKVNSVPVATQVLAYAASVAAKTTTAITWVRVRDAAGNWSRWYPTTR